MTGLRPGTTGVRDLHTHFRENMPEAVTMPQYFKNHGYVALGFGKLYHNDPAMQDSLSWTDACWIPPVSHPILAYASPENMELAGHSPHGKAHVTEAAEVPDTAYPDGMVTAKALEAMNDLSEQKRPFFLGVGYYKPHLPFTAPKRYWDLYKRDEISLSDLGDAPLNGSKLMFRSWSEPGSYLDISVPEPYPDSLARRLKHGYAACVSFIDAQIGKLLDELERLDLHRNTIVVIWGDHGWKLGEYGRWSKHSNMEIDTRIPLIIKVPGMEPMVSRDLVESIDLYPTLACLAGLPEPPNLEGEFLLEKRRDYAISEITRDSVIGFGVRIPGFRYIEWRSMKHPDQILDAELYDHRNSHLEMQNRIADPEHEESIKDLRAYIEEMLIP
jgi:arylsulfatase A-like enzyme